MAKRQGQTGQGHVRAKARQRQQGAQVAERPNLKVGRAPDLSAARRLGLRAGAVGRLPDSSISLACARVLAVISAPPSIRASSSTRSVGASRASSLVTPSPLPRLADAKMRVGARRHLRQMRDAQHLPVARPASAAAGRPWPPPRRRCRCPLRRRPASAPGPTSLATTWMASAMRDSSPPDATRASGPSGCFGWLATRNSTSLQAVARRRRAAGPARLRGGPPAIASACIASVTRCASSLAAKRRFFDSCSARARNTRFRFGGARRASASRIGGLGQRGESRLGFGEQCGQRLGPHAMLARDVVDRRQPAPRRAAVPRGSRSRRRR